MIRSASNSPVRLPLRLFPAPASRPAFKEVSIGASEIRIPRVFNFEAIAISWEDS